MNVIDQYLKNYDESRYSLSKLSGLTESTLSSQTKMPLSKLPISTIRAN